MDEQLRRKEFGDLTRPSWYVAQPGSRVCVGLELA